MQLVPERTESGGQVKAKTSAAGPAGPGGPAGPATQAPNIPDALSTTASRLILSSASYGCGSALRYWQSRSGRLQANVDRAGVAPAVGAQPQQQARAAVAGLEDTIPLVAAPALAARVVGRPRVDQVGQ